MKETGESYSTAARNVANAPLSTGWLSLDSALDGGIRKGAMYLFGSTLDNHQDLNDKLLLNLTLPNEQVALISNRTEEEIISSLTNIYLVGNVSTDNAPSSGHADDLRPMNREQLKAHLAKNLLVSTIEAGAHPMEETEAIKSLLEANPKVKVIYTDISAKRNAIDVEVTASMERELQEIAVRFELPVVMSSRYTVDHLNGELREYRMTRAGTIVHQAYAGVYLIIENNTPVFTIWKNRGGACSEGLLANFRQRISL